MLWLVAFIFIITTLAFQRAALAISAISIGLFLFFLMSLSSISWFSITFYWVVFFIFFASFSISKLREKWFTYPIYIIYKKIMPTMSRTEKEALSAGTVGWEGDLFSGMPDWNKLLSFAKPVLSEEERLFLDGPVEQLCKMIDDWEITHRLRDLPQYMWDFLKQEGFFALIIPKKYGGKAFSAYAHSQILMKVSSRSTTVGSTIAVPNSLGPAELLLHYGTNEQKEYYLPRLARGEEVPCFALTGPEAGSDAGAMTDTGVICWGQYNGKKTLGILLNWNKRYITLAPIATVIGLAFKLYDPDHLLGEVKELGITCALVPRNLPGITIGRRHFPANIVFQNGPIQGKNVFIPIDWIIGGSKMAGNGWKMLMECLAAGRAISLPASSIGGAKALVYASGAYAAIRKQFNVSIGHFQGIEETLARMSGHSYMMDATRSFTVARIDQGEQPAVASAISKYHVTELGRTVASDAMDIHGGKAICLGPKNYVARFYESMPIAITVEGANILTRNMIIFGQGVMRCHPYVLTEYESAKMTDLKKGLKAFDKALIGHLGFFLSNVVRTFILSLTASRFVIVPKIKNAGLKRYYQQATRFSSAFALIADVSLLTLGGSLKRQESISARLGDILSYLYVLSAVLKHYYDQNEPEEDLPFVHWSCQTCFYLIQESFSELLKNFPNQLTALILKMFIFPFGKRFSKPSDKLNHQVSGLVLSPSSARYRLTSGIFTTPTENNNLADLEDAFLKSVVSEPIEKQLKQALHNKLIEGVSILDQAKNALEKQLISHQQFNVISDAISARDKVIAVDDFAPGEI